MVRLQRKSKLNLVAVSVLLAAGFVAWMLLGSVSASSAGNSGGMTIATAKAKKAPRFGFRTLKEGMAGNDVRILKGLVKSRSYLNGSLSPSFDGPTTSAVKKFQKDADISPSGVVTRSTAKSMKKSMQPTEASWYGPGLYGNGVACGGTLRATTVGVAHKTLPCGTKVMISYKGRYLITKVIDRGPYIKGRAWDLTYAAADSLGFIASGVADVRSAVISGK